MNNYNIQKIGEIGPDELIFNTDKDAGVFSGGFNVNSIMMKSGLSPIMTLNTQQTAGGDSNRVSDLFESLVIPNWALTYGGERYKEPDDDEDDEEIDDELHDKLLGLVREHDNKLKQKQNRQTKKQKQKQNQNIKKGGTRKRR